jgi:hypothetical protein
MIENEKIDCIDSLIFGLNRTAHWRKKMAAQYPSDPRNGRAAECLAGLATDVPEPSTWAMMILGFAGIGFMAYPHVPRSYAQRRSHGLSRFSKR